MRDNVKTREMTSTQLFILTQQVCQWWNAVFIQSDRFFNMLNISHGGTPWDNSENNSMFVADRMFLIIAIYHAVEDLQKLNIELQRNNDTSLQLILEDIEKIAPWSDLKDLRDMNVHNLDYLVNKGKKEKDFRSTVKIGNNEILTTAAWTHINHDENVILIGKIRIQELINVMKRHFPFVSVKTKQIYEKTLLG